MASDDEDDDDRPTLQTVGSYVDFRDESLKVARVLERTTFFVKKRIDLNDVQKVRRAEQIARQLRRLAKLFDAWPTAPPAVVAEQRRALVPQALALMAEGLGWLRTIPDQGTLGDVPKP